MSSELSAYTGSTALGRPAAQAGPDTSRSLAGVEFMARIHSWVDLPATVQDRYPELALAEGVHQSALSISGVTHLLRQAWKAYPDRVVVLNLTQRPQVLANGRPVGQWALKTTVLHAAGPVVKTSATMHPGSDTATTDDGPAVAVPARQARAADVFGYLPAKVRRSVERAVPTPTVWVGELGQWVEPGAPDRQELVMLRHDDATAVVVKATRAGRGDLSRLNWGVTEWVYTLGSDLPQLGSSTPDRLRLGRT